MRTGAGEVEFSSFLERLDNGELQFTTTGGSYIKMPRACIMDEEADVIDWVYDTETLTNTEHLKGRALLAVRSDDCDDLNERILMRLHPHEEHRKYFAVDDIDRDDPECVVEMMAQDYLSFTTNPGMPPYELHLKKRSRRDVMLLRNIDLACGLCNGTRLVVNEMHQNSLLCTILTGTRAGETTVITKLPLKYKGGKHDGGVAFTRTQFPIRLSYCMTINKAQGQTLDRVGIILRTPVFAHGQLYVALSRVRSMSSLRIYTTLPQRLKLTTFNDEEYVPIRNVVNPYMANE